MNRARQAEITQQILEVVAGADALEYAWLDSASGTRRSAVGSLAGAGGLHAVAVIVLIAGLVIFVSPGTASQADGPGPPWRRRRTPRALYGKPITLPPRPSDGPEVRPDRRPAQRRRRVVGDHHAERARRLHPGAVGDRRHPGGPFPSQKFGSAKFKIDRSRQRDILLEVLLTSHKLGVTPIDDFLELVPQGGRWPVHVLCARGARIRPCRRRSRDRDAALAERPLADILSLPDGD